MLSLVRIGAIGLVLYVGSGRKWREPGNYCNDRALCVCTAGFRGYGRELFVSDVTAVLGLGIVSMPN